VQERRKSNPRAPPNKTKNKTKEEEFCEKLLKKIKALSHPVFNPARFIRSSERRWHAILV